jgi:hypothetical protein
LIRWVYNFTILKLNFPLNHSLTGLIGNGLVSPGTAQMLVSAIPPHFELEIDLDIVTLGTAWTG